MVDPIQYVVINETYTVDTLIKFIGCAIASWMISSGASPIQYLKFLLGLSEDKMGKSKVRDWAIELLSCAMCINFWITLSFFSNVWIALCGSFLAYLIDKLTRKIMFI